MTRTPGTPETSAHDRGPGLSGRPRPDRPGRAGGLPGPGVPGATDFRREVDDLLAAHFRSGTFLDDPLGPPTGTGPATANADNTVPLPAGLGEADEHGPADAADALYCLQPPARADSLGRIGHYEVLEVLGRGRFGTVLKAFDDHLHRVVALKVLAPSMAAAAAARRRFLREARASAQVRHENVVHVYAVEERPLPYPVMEYVPVETLPQRLDRTGPLEPAEVFRLGRQIAVGLAAAHATGLVDRDIKPGSILLQSPPSPVPSRRANDWGLGTGDCQGHRLRAGPGGRRRQPEPARGGGRDARVHGPGAGHGGRPSTTGPTCSAGGACRT